jgi:hypothetical protein
VPLLYVLPAGVARRYFVPGVVLVLLPIQLDDVRTVAELLVSPATADAAVSLVRPVLTLATLPCSAWRSSSPPVSSTVGDARDAADR